jgi:hypothetical protein
VPAVGLIRVGPMRSPAGGGGSHRWRSSDCGQSKRRRPIQSPVGGGSRRRQWWVFADEGVAAVTSAMTQARQDTVTTADKATNCYSRRRTKINLKKNSDDSGQSNELLFKTKNKDQSEEKPDEEHARNARNRGEDMRTLTLKIDSVYHVRKSTCIRLRAKGPNIYVCVCVYRMRRIYKEPPREIQ